jgi:alpha-amylase
VPYSNHNNEKILSPSLSTFAITLKVNETKQLMFTALPSNASNKVITYTSSDETIATVSHVGLVKAVKAGTATINATNAKTGLIAQCKVTVSPILVSSITIGIETITGSTLGYTKQLTATVLPSSAANKNITWHSSDPSKVNVSSDGMITVLDYGVIIITAKSTDGSNVTSSSCTVTIKK